MASRSDNLPNLFFWAESPQTTPNYDNDYFLFHLYKFNVLFPYVLVSLFARPHNRQRFNHNLVCIAFWDQIGHVFFTLDLNWVLSLRDAMLS